MHQFSNRTRRRQDRPTAMLSFVAAKRWTLIDDYDLCWSREADRRECRLVVVQPKHAYVTVVVSRNDHDATWKSPRIRQFLYHIMSLVIDTLQHGRPFFRRCHQSWCFPYFASTHASTPFQSTFEAWYIRPCALLALPSAASVLMVSLRLFLPSLLIVDPGWPTTASFVYKSRGSSAIS